MTTRIDVSLVGARPVVRLANGMLAARRLPDERGAIRVALVATRALLLAGDAVRIDVRVGAGVRLEIVEIAGTVAYNMRGGSASWTVEINCAGDLVWDAEPFVVADGAVVDRSTTVRLDTDANVRLREQIVLGRSGESGGRVHLAMSAFHDGAPLLVESLTLDAVARLDPAVLAGARCLDSVTSLGSRLADPDALQLEGPGSIRRRLVTAAHESDLTASA
ncbi:MAG: urease accessory protein UreD [Aeromicrobium sp.]